LRIGKNATILVDAGTTFQLPNMVQDGQTLRTLASVKSGRVDFKVDHVGFTNDFQVVTPQTTLAVRGTGLFVGYSPSKGVEIGGHLGMHGSIEQGRILNSQSNIFCCMSYIHTSQCR
jgi:hypothetical protein